MTPATLPDEATPLTHDLDEPFDPEDVKQAALTYAQSFASRNMLSEAAVVYGLLGMIEKLERANGN